MPEKCALSQGWGVLGRDPRDLCVHSHTVSAWGGWGGGGAGGYHWGGGGGLANREPGSFILSQQ